MGAPDTRKPPPRSPWPARLRPAALPAVLLAGGIALGGVPGFIASFLAALLGVEAIPVLSVVGTVDPHKPEVFGAAFEPPPFTRGRWTQMCAKP